MRSLCYCELIRVLLLLLLLYGLNTHGQTVQILSPRPPISFPVGTNVTFQCEATGFGSAKWEVNMTQLAGPNSREAFAARGIITEPGPTLQEVGNISYTLYALASFENNRTVIRCQASMGVAPSYVSSDSVTLLVFGLPNPPTGLSSFPQAANTLRLQWEAPFSLPGENISYILHTRNLRTDATLSGVTVAGISTTFTSPEGDQACDRYKFTVCSNNAVGPSENCTTVEASTPSAPKRFEGLNVSMTMDRGLAVTLSFNVLSCQDYPVTNYSAILTLPESFPQRLGPFLPTGNSPERINITGADGLLENRMYTASVEARNQFGRTFSGDRTIYTTDVQSASVEVEGDNVTITCTFLSGSNAQGCHVVIRISSSPTPLWMGNISRDNNSNTVERIETIELPAENNYLVSVHDLEADGSVGQTALSATVNVVSTITTASQGTSTPSTQSTSPPSRTTTDSGVNVTLSTASQYIDISNVTPATTNTASTIFSTDSAHATETAPTILSTDVNLSMGAIAAIAVVIIVTIVLVVGVLVGGLLYHCINKHSSQLKKPKSTKPESSSHQQQQASPEYEKSPEYEEMRASPEYEEMQAVQEYEVPVTIGGEETELRENVYEPVQH